MKLPNAENADVDIAKLRDYCLNPYHPKGKHKARVFREKLDITRDDAERLRQLILEEALIKYRKAVSSSSPTLPRYGGYVGSGGIKTDATPSGVEAD